MIPNLGIPNLNPIQLFADGPLEAIFAENGVPWSDKPLLPIMSAGENAPASAERA